MDNYEAFHETRNSCQEMEQRLACLRSIVVTCFGPIRSFVKSFSKPGLTGITSNSYG